MKTPTRTLFDYGDEDKKYKKLSRLETKETKPVPKGIIKDQYYIQEMLREKFGNTVDITVRHTHEHKVYSEDMELVAEYPVYRAVIYHMVLDRIYPKKNKGKQILKEYLIERGNNGEYFFNPRLEEI